MTVVVAVKVFDGIVLAADSATTLPLTSRTTGQVANFQVYYNADKVFNLHRDLPLGLATWGTGHIEAASISALAKDLRRRLMRPAEYPEWELTAASYTVEEVAENVVKFFHDELFSNSIEPRAQPTGLLLAGYSANAKHPEVWEILLDNPQTRPVPQVVLAPDDSGWLVRGQAIPVSRLIYGVGPGLRDFMRVAIKDEHKGDLERFLEGMAGPAVVPPMPFADAIAFARFCAEVTVGYSRFTPGADTVGGPIDIAAISAHEGFKWVQRKHYYPADLNPRRPHEHDH